MSQQEPRSLTLNKRRYRYRALYPEKLTSYEQGTTMPIRVDVYAAGRTSDMKRKMTLVFHDEDLYTQLKIEAVRRRTTASNIVADAIREWLDTHEDAELLPAVEAARSEWKEKGGRPWSEAERELGESMKRPEGSNEAGLV